MHSDISGVHHTKRDVMRAAYSGQCGPWLYLLVSPTSGLQTPGPETQPRGGWGETEGRSRPPPCLPLPRPALWLEVLSL